MNEAHHNNDYQSLLQDLVKKNISSHEMELLFQYACLQAKDDFFTYRQLISQTPFKQGWFVRELCKALQEYTLDLANGENPILVLQTPPRHGKTQAVIDYITWLLGVLPNTRVIYCSYSENLGVTANVKIRDVLQSNTYKSIFPNTSINKRNVTTGDQPKRNSHYLEIVNSQGIRTSGFFRNTTVQGQITGFGFDVGVIDDPIKDRSEANSTAVRNRQDDWFTNAFLSRLEAKTGIIIIMTRWHVDDTVGYIEKKFKESGVLHNLAKLRIIKYPAIATEDELYRKKGEALFPELMPLKLINFQKEMLFSDHFESLYQQNPIISGGNLFKESWFQYYTYDNTPDLKYRYIYVDTASKTGDKNDYSVMQCWGVTEDGKAVLLDQERDRLSPTELFHKLVAFYEKHKFMKYKKVILDHEGNQGEHYTVMGTLRGVKIEDMGIGTSLIERIKKEANIPCSELKPYSKKKEDRAYDVLAFFEHGKVMIPFKTPWIHDFIQEFLAFPTSASHDDQVDTCIYAVTDLLYSNNHKVDFNLLTRVINEVYR